MTIMSFKQGLIVDFVPEYGGNRKHKLKTVIGIKPLNNDGSIDFMDELTKQLVDCDDIKERAKVSKEVAKQSFIDHVAYVENYMVVDKDNKEIEITTGEQLYSDGSRGLINEITLAIENSSSLSEGQAKNFSGDSAGSD